MTDTHALTASERPRAVLAWITWAHFLNDGVANYLPGILPFIVAVRHVPAGLAGSFMTALLLGQSLQPLSGWVADRIGGRALLLGGVTLSTLAGATIGWAGPVWMVLGLLLLTGIGNTAFHPQALSLTRRLVASRQGLGTSVFLVGGEIGRSLGPLAAGFVVSRLGLPWIWVVAIPYCLTVPGLLRIVPEQPRRDRQVPPIAWRRHLRPAGALLLFSTVRSATIYEVITLAPIRWHQTGGSLVSGAALVTTLIGVGIVGNLAGGAVNDRVGRRSVLLATTAVAIIALLAFITLGGGWIWPVLGLMGVALFGSGASTMLIGQQIFRENPALGSGVALGLANGLGAILVIPLTWIAAHLQDATAVWILIGLTVVTAPTIWAMPAGG